VAKPSLWVGEQRVELQPFEYESEKELQELLAENPGLLPVADVSPRFANAVVIGRECKTTAGPMDLLLMNDEGLITLVETKLARNPEQKREVVAQCLNYLLEMPVEYDAYEAFYRTHRGDPHASLYADLRQSEDEDEGDFRNNVEAHLRDRDVLVAIVGDRIRNVDQLLRMVDALNPRAVAAEATFCVMGLRRYTFQTPTSTGRFYVPRVCGTTVVTERKVLKVAIETATGEAVPSRVLAVEEEGPHPQTDTAAGGSRNRTVLQPNELESRLRSIGLDSVWDSFLALVPDSGFELAYRVSAVIVQLAIDNIRIPVLYVRPDGSTVLSNNAWHAVAKIPEASQEPLETLRKWIESDFPNSVARSMNKGGTSYILPPPGMHGHETALLGALQKFRAAMLEQAG